MLTPAGAGSQGGGQHIISVDNLLVKGRLAVVEISERLICSRALAGELFRKPGPHCSGKKLLRRLVVLYWYCPVAAKLVLNWLKSALDEASWID